MLANTDFNLLWFLPYGYSYGGFYFINLISFAITLYSLSSFFNISDFDKIKSRYINAFLLIVLPLTLSFSIRLFVEIIYPERLLAMTLIIFLLLYKKAIDTDKTIWFILALIAAIYATYQKEISFGLFIVSAVFLFLFMPRSKRHNLFNAALIINGAAYLAVYYFVIIANSERFYSIGIKSAGLDYVLEYALFFGKTWIIAIIFIFAAARSWFLIIKKDRNHLFFDLSLFMSCAYASAYLLLGAVNIPRSYFYYAPSVFIFAPALAYWLKYLYFNRQKTLFFIIVAALLLSIRSFDLENPIRRRRSASDFVAELSIYSRLNKPLILVTKDGKPDWKIEGLLSHLKYKNSKVYTLGETDNNYSLSIRPISEEIDKNAVYIFENESDRLDPKFSCFRPLTQVDTPFSVFTAAICD